MQPTNFEIKARTERQSEIREILLNHKADYKGLDHQIDTYFKVNFGRMKLREGNIENNLIFYHRQNKKGPRQADIMLYRPQVDSTLKPLLTAALGVWKIVDKKREIYFIDNVKFHIDSVKSLGSFMEIEAIDETGKIGLEKLRQQCEYYLKLLKIPEQDLESGSYSDMVKSPH